MNERVRMILDRVEGPAVLDLGAVQHNWRQSLDDGWLHDHLCNRFDTVVGVDMLCEDVAELNRRGYELVCADVTQMDLDVTADTIVAGELIEHVDKPGEMLRRMDEHLSPDGKLVFSTPNPWAWIHLIRLVAGRMHINDEHVAWYGPTVMRQLLDRHGFELVDSALVQRERAGVMKWTQRLGIEPLNGVTWIFEAERQ